ncbi:MAG: YceI family protein [Vicinamibacterales bacterium]
MSTSTTTTTDIRTFDIDPAHSEFAFHVRHLLTKVRGHFAEFSGRLTFDEAAPERSSVAIEIRAASITTNQSERDAHLRSGDFFAVDAFPTVTFTSSRVAANGGGAYLVTGELSIRGTTKVIEVPVTYLGAAKDPWGHVKLAFEAEVAINRKDFGLNWNAALETGGFLVGDEVRISASVQAVAR